MDYDDPKVIEYLKQKRNRTFGAPVCDSVINAKCQKNFAGARKIEQMMLGINSVIC